MAGMWKAARSLAELPPESKGVITWIELWVYLMRWRDRERRADPPLKNSTGGPRSGARS